MRAEKAAALRRNGLAVLAAGLAAAGGWWAGRVALSPPASPPAAPTYTEVRVTEQTVGRSRSVSVALVQGRHAVARNLLSGVVTMVRPGVKKPGDVVYAVAAAPVRVVQGSLPFYRDLVIGSAGADVLQLEEGLKARGLLQEADANYTAVTAAAVREWQRQLREAPTGTVPLGELVAVPSLTDPVWLGPEIAVGALVAGAEESVMVAGPRVFEVELTREQAADLPSDARIRVHHEEASWPAVIADSRVSESGSTVLTLSAPGGGPVCGKDCAKLPDGERLTLRADIVVQEPVSGPAVPVAAVLTDAAGQAYVERSGGGRVDVVIKGSQGGIVVVGGVKDGDMVRVRAAVGGAGVIPAPIPSASGAPPS